MRAAVQHLHLLLAALLATASATQALAAACATAASGAWSSAATWAAPCNVAGGPVAGDTVTIGGAHTVTLSGAAAAATLTIANPTAANGIDLNGNSLTLSGALTLLRPTNTAASTLAVGSGTLNAASISIAGGSNANRIAQLTVSSGTVNVSGSVTFTGTAAQARFISTGAANVNVGGDFASGGTLTTSGTGTLTFNGSGAQIVGAYATYNNLSVVKSGGTATLAGNSTVGAALTVNGGSFDMGGNTLAVGSALNVAAGTFNANNTLTVAGATSIAGTFNINAATGSKTFAGPLSVNPGGVWNNSANAGVTLQGGLAYNGASFVAGSGTYTFDSNSQAISGTLSIASIAVTGVTLSNNGNLTVNAALAGSGGVTNAAGSQLHLGFTGALGITTLTASAAGNLVEYGAAGNQSIKAPAGNTYERLSLSGSGAKSAAAGLTINGDLIVSGAASFTTGAVTHSLLGNWLVDSSAAIPLVASGSTINFNAPAAPAARSIGGTSGATLAFNTVNINNASGVALGKNASFAGTLTVTGTLTPAATVLVSGAGTLTGTGTAQVTRTATVAGFDNQYTIATKTLTSLTVEYIAASAQSVSGRSYYGLKINNPAGATLAANVTVNGALTLSAGALNVGANLLTLNGPTIAGNATLLATSGASSLTFGGLATGVIVPSSVTQLNNLTVDNSNGVTVATPSTLSVAGTLTLSNGVLALGSSTLAATAACPASVSRANGFVSGKLQLTFPASASTTCTYAVGSGTSYAPLGMTLVAPAGGGGTLTAESSGAEHPLVAASGLDASRDANRYWTLWSTGDTMVATSYGLTFNFVSGDLDSGADAGNFIVARYASGTWTLPTPVSATATSTSVANLTLPLSAATGSMVFLVGEAYSLCFSDNFNRADGAPGSAWSVGRQGGSYTPALFNNRLRLTDTSLAAGTWATLQRMFPAAGNKVTAEFDHYAYGGTGADGIAVILSNAAVAPAAGAFGGSLGYAQKSNPGSDCSTPGGCPGFAGGWMGLALDEYGNYSAATEGRYGGSPARIPSSVALRGSGSGMSGYRYLTGTSTLTPAIDNNGTASPPHRYRVIVDHRDNIHAWISVERDTTGGGGSYTTILGDTNCATMVTSNCFDAKDPGYSQDSVPANFYFSFTGASGASTNAHEIDALRICTALGQVTPSLNHIRLEHGGQACTGLANPASVRVKACADASCNALYLGSVTVDLSNIAGATWSGDPVTFSGGQTLLTLSDPAAAAVTLGATASAPAASGATRCFNGATETCALNFSACTFDVIEVGAAAYAPIYTKLAATPFNLDVLSLAGSALTVNRVEVVDASSGTCSSYASLQDTSTALPSAFAANQRKTFAFSYARAARNARVRVTYSTSQYSCSSDNFAIRPTAYALTSSATQTGSSGSPVFRAGADGFALTATALPGYDGTPKLNTGLLTTSLASLGTLGTATFPAAALGSGVSTASGYTYSEVGNFALAQNAVYDDGYAYVDSAKAQPECTSDFSNTAVAGKYGCMFGAAPAGPFGRFVPNHFAAVAALADACSAGAAPFTYMGQGFSVTRGGAVSAQVVEARNAGNIITRNYTGAYAGGAVALGAEDSDNGSNLGASLRFFGGGALGGTWSNGVFALSATSLSYLRPAEPASAAWGPFEALAIGVTVNDPDVGTAPQVSGADMNPGVAGGSLFTHKKMGTLRMRYGRLKLVNSYGSEALPLTVPVQAQYWNPAASAGWQSNVLDACTSTANLSAFAGNSASSACFGTGCSANNAGPVGSVILSDSAASGLLPSAAAPVGATYALAAGSTAIRFNPPALRGTLQMTLIAPAWLQIGGADPGAELNFGIYRGSSNFNRKLIQLREVY